MCFVGVDADSVLCKTPRQLLVFASQNICSDAEVFIPTALR